MLKRRAPRVITTGFLLAVTVSGLAACRTSPNVAAYVGDSQVTVTELRSAVDERLTDEAVAAFAETDEETFTRRVLSLLVQEEVYAEAAERYDVRVDDDDVRARIDELLGDDDPAEVFGQLAQQGIGREDVFENVRQQLVRRQIAEAEGEAEGLTDEALRARYGEVREDLAQVSFGYITVPDQATADAVLAQLTAAPDSYPAVAAQYPGATTLPALEPRGPEELPGVLAEGIAAAAPNTGFTTAVPEAGGVVVTFVEGPVYPSFEEVRPQLENEASEAVQEAGNRRVEAVREDLGVTVNPRFGVLEDGRLVAADGGVVDILGDEDPVAAPAE
ncbi:SurA N-terminal domain-containing protein [Blastococcus mobilis]|uniref:Peptidyl-prolyl cis-trans isomerase SurA n=1 Tax=Blastococcus mobilis TaxID=1938746 RepID=A0A238W4Y1_9ACTN|nr:peptidylprolyl isomerase [Blastococcus mobilis]SNR41548.1 peptidyl-prolyl cis-trans isomerase SurA [Blastococcus mobilis]